jgi:peptidoglycan hydrolase CwlO-like protein
LWILEQTIETLQTAQTQHSALATRLESENSDLHRQVQALKQSMEAMKDSHEDTGMILSVSYVGMLALIQLVSLGSVASLRELESEYDSLRAQSMDQDDVYQQLADKDHELQELHAQLQQAVAAKNSADGARSAQRREFESEMSALKSTMEQLKQRSAEMELKLQQSTNQSAASQQAAQDAVHATSRIKLELAQVNLSTD